MWKNRGYGKFYWISDLCFPNNKMGPLYYQVVLRNKDNFLKYKDENFNTKIKLTYDVLLELKWWKRNLLLKPIKNPKITETIYANDSRKV